MKHSKIRFSHTQVIALGFFIIISVGTVLLMLPAATKNGQGATFTEALFTATSASCVTGLVQQDTFLYWTGFGQAVILLLIQLGGLGFMTISTFFALALRKSLGLRQREILSESINSTQLGGILALTKLIIRGTVIIELLGTAILATRFIPLFGVGEGLWCSLFHSISAFCNAGFDLMGRYGAYSSFVPVYNDPVINITIMALIIIGGLGFLVWHDIIVYRFHLRRYKLHSKIVLFTTAILIFGGAVLFFIVEYNASSAGFGLGERTMAAFFNSVTSRTAGFNTVDLASMSDCGKLLMIILMFIGGSPGSTAGGIKTTTMAVMLLCAFSHMRQTRGPEIFGRRLEDDALHKASAVFFTNLSLSLAAAFIICAIDALPPLDVLFECFSAGATVGVTVGITRSLSLVSKYILIFLMFCGRVGSLSFASALAAKKVPAPVTCPIEKITIG